MGDRRLQDIQSLQSRIEVLESHIDEQYIARSSLEKQNEMLSFQNHVMTYQIYNAEKSVQDQLPDYTLQPNRRTSPKSTGGQTINFSLRSRPALNPYAKHPKVNKNHFTRSKKREEDDKRRIERIATLRSLYNFPK
jgi:hypothetical protein